jgi:hypothetical protein
MKTDLKRRDFLTKCFKAGVTGCALLYGNKLSAQDPVKLKKSDLKNLTYCGFTCNNQCTLYKATMENSMELKMKAYKEFKWKEKFNVDFDADKIFCYGCKPKDKQLSINVTVCTVRKCAIEKGHDCCIECTDLISCDKELWKNYPKFKEHMLDIQKTYQA